jgi:hypothetical protein
MSKMLICLNDEFKISKTPKILKQRILQNQRPPKNIETMDFEKENAKNIDEIYFKKQRPLKIIKAMN